jgi:hypothetical protein
MRSLFVNSFLLASFVTVATGGCVTRNHFAARSILPDDGSHGDAVQRARQTIAHVFPTQYCSTQRAIIMAGRKQFTCDGLLTVSPGDGYHLALVSSFGTVTELRVEADGATEVLKVTPLLPEDWGRRFVARDLRWLFVPPDNLQPAGQLADGRLVLQIVPDSTGASAEYIFSAAGSRWQELDLARNGKTFYRVVVEHYLKFPATAAEIPDEFAVIAESYRLELRVAAVSTTPAKQEAKP